MEHVDDIDIGSDFDSIADVIIALPHEFDADIETQLNLGACD